MYKQSFTEEQQRKLREHNEMLKSIGKNTKGNINLLSYKPVKFDSSTSNQKMFKSFTLEGRPKIES